MKLIDFGLAVKGLERPAELQIVGTPGYIAPEVFMRRRFNEKIDIYSCGIVLYFMLAGSLPFSGVTSNEVLEQNEKNNIKFDRFPWISKEAKNFILKLTSTDPKLRPSTADALRDKWLAKNINLHKPKNIGKNSVSMLKLDTYAFYNDLVKEIPSEFADSSEPVTPRARSNHRLSLKVNRIPEFDVSCNRFSDCRERALRSDQLKSFSELVFNHEPLSKFSDCLHLGKHPEKQEKYSSNGKDCNNEVWKTGSSDLMRLGKKLSFEPCKQVSSGI